MTISLRKFRGFTLIELLIAVAIVGILAAVAYPSYTESVKKARRVDAMNNLLRLQIEQEKYRASNTTYASTFATLLADATITGTTIDSSEDYYTLSISNVSPTAFVISAAPKTGSPQVGDTCGTFRVNQNGPDYAGAAVTANAGCWNQ